MLTNDPPIPDLQYFDLQVNGVAGVDFNSDEYTELDLHRACSFLQQDGAHSFLPTIITDDIDKMAARLKRLAEFRQRNALVREMIAGFHIEGPFISAEEGYVGAHPARFVREPNLDQMRRLLDAAQGLTRIVTVAPELDSGLHVTRFLANQGVVVSAGHCNPSLEHLRAAIDAGLAMFTHLGNGCPHVLPRHDNIIERVLSLSDRLRISFIADGYHVPYFALRNYIQIAGIDRCVIVSDAISATGLGPGRFPLGDRLVDVGEDLVPRLHPGHQFAGSATSLGEMIRRLHASLQLSREELLQLTYASPRNLISAAKCHSSEE